MNKPLSDLRQPARQHPASLALLAILLSALLGACATPPPSAEPPAPLPPTAASTPEPVADVTVTPSGVEILLAYHQNLRALNPAEIARELTNLNSQAKTPMLAMRKAMALSMSRTTNDLALAQIHLDSVLSSTDQDAEALKPLARLLGTQWSEQRRLSDSLDRLNTQARENQRKTDQLNEKLEALKAIERTLPASPAAPGPATGASSVKQQGG